MNSTFWTTLAQVSATFISLIFVGLSLYISSIRKATQEIQLEFKFNLEEKSTSLMQVSVLSNLIFFLFPFNIAICLISGNNLSLLWWFVPINCGTLLVFMFLNEFKPDIRKQINVMTNQRSSFFTKIRLSFGKVIIYLLMVALIALVIILFLDSRKIYPYEMIIMILSTISILLGISYGIWDIFVFDSNNIFFYLDDQRRDDIGQRLVSNLRSEVYKLDYAYLRYTKVIESQDYQELIFEMSKNLKLSQTVGSDYVVQKEKEIQRRFSNEYQLLKHSIPDDHQPSIIAAILDKGNYVTASEIRHFILGYNSVLKRINDFADQLRRKIEGLEELLGNEKV